MEEGTERQIVCFSKKKFERGWERVLKYRKEVWSSSNPSYLLGEWCKGYQNANDMGGVPQILVYVIIFPSHCQQWLKVAQASWQLCCIVFDMTWMILDYKWACPKLTWIKVNKWWPEGKISICDNQPKRGWQTFNLFWRIMFWNIFLSF